MRKVLLATAAITAVIALAPLDATAPFTGAGVNWSAADAQEANINVSFFFDTLAPHGKWSRHGKYGHVFIPTVDRDWAPYTEGRWIWTAEHGWYWQSDEPFAWAVYHYGRWFYVSDVGWVWVPGTKWGPAWVSWRKSDDYVGWAPLPPVRDGYVVDIDIDVNIEIDESYWHFVEAPRFLEPNLVVVIIDARDRRDIYQRTEYVGTVRVENNIVINNVINIDYVEAETKQEVTVHKVETVDKPDAVKADEQSVQIFNPEISPEEDKKPAETVELKEGTPPAPSDAAQPTDAETPADAPNEATGQDGEPAAPADAPASADTTAPEAQPGAPATETPADMKPQDVAPAPEQPAEAPQADTEQEPAQVEEQAAPPADEPKDAPAEMTQEPKAEEKAAPETVEEPQPENKPAEATEPEAQPEQTPEAQTPKEKPSEEAKEPEAKEQAPTECTPEMQAAGTCP